MKKIIIASIAYLSIAAANAQSFNYVFRKQIPVVEVVNGKKITSVEARRDQVSLQGNDIRRKVTFLGTPYLYDTFKTATYTINKGQTTDTAPILVNLVTDELYVKNGNEITTIEKADFTLDNREFVWLDGHFYEQLHDGNVKLLKRHARDVPNPFVNNVSSASGYGSSNFTEGEITSKEIYYLAFHDGTVLRDIKISQKSVVNALTKENKHHFTNGEFDNMNENDGLIKSIKMISDLDEKSLIKVLAGSEQKITP